MKFWRRGGFGVFGYLKFGFEARGKEEEERRELGSGEREVEVEG